MNEGKTIERLQAEIKRLQSLVWEWEEYDGEIKTALGTWRYAAPTVAEVIALLVRTAETETTRNA